MSKKEYKLVKLPEFMKFNKDLPYEVSELDTKLEKLKRYLGLYEDPDREVFFKTKQQMVDYIYNSMGIKNEIPVGTKLYHGTINKDFVKIIPNLGDDVIFFALEPTASMWYTGKRNMVRDNPDKYGYVYEFTVKKPIKIDRISYWIGAHILNWPECEKGVCVHPLISGQPIEYIINPPYFLSIEVTIPLKKYFENGSIKFTKKYRTDMDNLKQHEKIKIDNLDVVQYKDFLLFSQKENTLAFNFMDDKIKRKNKK